MCQHYSRAEGKRHLGSAIGALQPLEDAIRNFLLPAITGKTALDRELFTLPARLGGLNITNPTIMQGTKTCAGE